MFVKSLVQAWRFIKEIDINNDDTEDDNELSRGDRVEAEVSEESKWYKGKIMRVNSDGTYDIEYDDGDVERRVRKSLVRKLEVHQKVDIKIR